MNTLFDIGPVLPAGFSYSPGFITEAEELQLIKTIEQFDLQNMKFHEYEAKRKVISFGQGWSFTEQQLKQGNPIPGEFDFLVERISNHLQILKASIAQFLITEYPVGSVINWHRDAPPFETIVGVSLLADCTFKLRPHDKEKQTRSATISLPVQRRSFYIMTGVSKNAWQHCTAPVEKVRYSLTFRTLRSI
ncbi:MAG TPA: alpha-ketoglutarate-dependent dioxygenase AlkB [Ferruginibacter sp.]|nr:alpha-ketoglutarate-dependent dioxygenase AlkB [Ferruginibacter sp.]